MSNQKTFTVYYGENIFEDADIRYYDVGTSIQDILIDLDVDPEKVSVMFNGDDLSYQPKEDEAVVMNVIPEGVDPFSWTAIAIYVAVGLAVGYLAYRMMPNMEQMGPDDATKRYRIDGARNEPKPYEPVPIVLGKHQVVPAYAAAPYSEFEGDDEYFNMLLSFGTAPLKIRDIKIGDTPISTYQHQMGLVDWYENNDENKVRNLWPDDVAQESINVDVVHPNSDGGDMSLDLTSNEGWVTRSTSGFGDEVAIDIIFPQGAIRVDEKQHYRTSAFQYQYQEQDGSWTTRARLAFRARDNQLHWNTPYSVWQSKDTGDYYVVGGGGQSYRDKTSISDGRSVNITDFVTDVEDTGNGEWLTIKGYTGPVTSDWISTNNNKQRRRSIRHYLPDYSRDTNTPVGLRVRKVFPKESPEDAQRIDGIKWQYIRTYRDLTKEEWEDIYQFNKTPINVGGVDYYTFRPVLMALRIKATDQLSGVIDNLNAEVTQVVPADWSFDWRKWTDKVDLPAGTQTGQLVPTEDPPSAYRWILQGPCQSAPLANERLDIDEIFNWRERCIAEGWKISSLIDYDSTVLKELQNVAFTGRAEFGYTDGKYTVVEKIERTYPVQVFTPKNSWDFLSERSYPEQTDGIRFEFENAETDYQKDEGIFYDPAVYNPDVGLDNRTGKFDGMEIWGVTDANLAYRHARFAYYEKMLRREIYTFSTDLEGLVATRGDLVRLQNDIIDIGLGSGRVDYIDGTTFSLDEHIDLDVGVTYGIEFRTATEQNGDYTHLITAVYNADGTFTGSIPAYINVGDFAIYGQVGNESLDAIITSISYTESLQCNITCVNAANEIFTLDGNPIPVFETGLNARADWETPRAPVIDDEISIDPVTRTINVTVFAIRNSRNSLQSAILEYRPYPVGEVVDEFFFSGEEGWQRISTSGGEREFQFEIDSPIRGNIYQLRARVVSGDGIYSSLSDTVEYTFASSPANVVSEINLSEFIDAPPTPDQRYSTINVVITPPNDPNYLASIVEYRPSINESWRLVGRVDRPDTLIKQVVESDGAEYEFRARSVSVFEEESVEGVSAFIKVINLLNPDYEDGLPETDDSIPNVTGLELFGQGNDTEFTGKDAKFSWRKSTVDDWLELGDEGSRGAGGTSLDQFFKDFLVQVWAQGELVRQEEVVDNHYIYGYEKNSEDYFRVNETKGAWRGFEIRVWQRSRAGQVSPVPAVLDVENPAPELPDNLIADAGLKSIIVSWDGEPSDTDFEGVLVWLSTTNTSQENLVYRGKDNIVNLQGIVLRDEFGNPTLEITAGTEYRVDIAPYDAFGYVGVAPVATYNVTTETLTDRDTNKSKPCPPGNVVVTENTVVKSLTPTISANVTWDASVGVWDETELTCDVNADPGIVTGYYIQWYATGGEVSERFTSSLTEQISNLDRNTTYNFKVKAIDWAGNESPWSSVITLTSQGDSTPPGDASGVTLTGGLDKVIISWTNPADEDWQATRVYLGTTSTFTADASNLKYEGRSDTTVLADVTNGVNYYVRLQTVDTSGNVSAISAAYGPVQPFKISSNNSNNFMENLAISGSKIANAAISTGKIANGAISNIKIADSAVDSNKLSNLSVTAAKLVDGSVESTKIADLAVGNAAIANLAVSNAKIANLAISTTKIQDAAITTALIDNAAITTAKIDNAAITEAKIGTAAISTAKIQDAAITNAKIGTLDAGKITTGTLDADRIGANTIDADKIYVTNLGAISADLGSITSGTITGATIQTSTSNPRVRLNSSAGIEAYNSVGTRTFNVKTDGAVTIGTGADAITISTSGNVTVPGSIIADDIVGNTIRTATSGSRVEMGPNINGDTGKILRVLSGSTETFSVDTSGNVSMIGSISMTGGSVDGNVTLDGVNTSTVKNNASDGKTAFDGTTLTRSSNAPDGSRGFSGVSNQTTPDGNVVSTVSYTYTQGSVPADFLLIYVREGTLAPTAANTAYTVNPVSGEIKLTLKPSTSYRFGVEAVRHYDGGLAGSGILSGSSWTTTTPAGNYTGSVDGTAATTVKDGAVKANAGLNASGDIRRTIGAALPTTNPSTSGLYMNSNYLGFYDDGWSNYFRSNGDALIGNLNSGSYVFWDGTTLSVAGDFRTGTGDERYEIDATTNRGSYYNSTNQLVYSSGSTTILPNTTFGAVSTAYGDRTDDGAAGFVGFGGLRGTTRLPGVVGIPLGGSWDSFISVGSRSYGVFGSDGGVDGNIGIFGYAYTGSNSIGIYGYANEGATALKLYASPFDKTAALQIEKGARSLFLNTDTPLQDSQLNYSLYLSDSKAGYITNDPSSYGYEIYSQANILGTVSQSAGVPTGNVIERGSNANGEYVRFADGTQIFTRDVTLDLTTTSTISYDFPATYAGTRPASYIALNNGTTAGYQSAGGAILRVTSTAWAVNVQTTDTETYGVTLVGIGRWF